MSQSMPDWLIVTVIVVSGLFADVSCAGNNANHHNGLERLTRPRAQRQRRSTSWRATPTHDTGAAKGSGHITNVKQFIGRDGPVIPFCLPSNTSDCANRKYLTFQCPAGTRSWGTDVTDTNESWCRDATGRRHGPYRRLPDPSLITEEGQF